MDEAIRARIAVVGAGCSGSLVVVQLLAQLTARGVGANIYLIDKTDRVSRGLAYDTEVDLHLLNVPAADMSALPADKLHFYNWARDRYPDVTPSSFLSRKIYGRYLTELFQSSLPASRSAGTQWSAEFQPAPNGSAGFQPAPNITVEVIKDTAVSFDKEHKVLKLASGRQLVLDRLILATGNFAPRNVLPASVAPLPSSQYINDPWSAEALDGLREDEDVLLIGTGLTTVDLVLDLYGRGHKGKITAVSRNGMLPQAHWSESVARSAGLQAALATAVVPPSPSPSTPSFIAIAPPFPTTAKAIFALVRRCCRESETLSVGAWRLSINSLRPHTQNIWKSLPNSEKQRLMRHCKSLWETHRHRMAPDVAAIILGLIDQGQLEIVAGRIAHIEPTAQRLVVSILRRGSSGTDTPGAGWKPAHQKTVARVINCTGPDIDLRNCPDKFIASLIESGCAQPDPLGLGLKTTDGGIVLEAQGPSPMTVAIGPLRKGHLWETTAVPELREQAVEVAQIVVDAIISAANQPLNFSAPVEQMLYYGVPTNGVANGSC